MTRPEALRLFFLVIAAIALVAFLSIARAETPGETLDQALANQRADIDALTVWVSDHDAMIADLDARLDALESGSEPEPEPEPPIAGDRERCNVAPDPTNSHDPASGKHSEHDSLISLLGPDEADAVFFADDAPFSDARAWCGGEVPGDGQSFLIAGGALAIYDLQASPRFGIGRVDGGLVLADGAEIVIDTLFSTPGSAIVAGVIGSPIRAEIIIADNGPIDVVRDPQKIGRGVITHGDLSIEGVEKSSHIQLAEDARAGDGALTLTQAPINWAAGDRLALTGMTLGASDRTGDRPVAVTEDEVVTIAAVDGPIITLESPLQFDHASDLRRPVVKAYAANLTRSIVIRSENPNADIQERGHFMVMHAGGGSVRHAAFVDLGRTDKAIPARHFDDWEVVDTQTNLQSRYPLHLHRTGKVNVTRIEGNVVEGSPGWGYVQHDSAAEIVGNVSFDVFAAHFVSETGNETGPWRDNIAIKAVGRGLGDHRHTVNYDIFRNGAGFALQSRLIEVENNVAAGIVDGDGFFWLSRGDRRIDVELAQLPMPGLINYRPSIDPQFPSIPHVTGNIVIASDSGLLIAKSSSANHSDSRTLITDLTAVNVRDCVDVQYTGHYTLREIDCVGAVGKARDGLKFGEGLRDVVVFNSVFDGFAAGFAHGDKNETAEDTPGKWIVDVRFPNSGPHTGLTGTEQFMTSENLTIGAWSLDFAQPQGAKLLDDLRYVEKALKRDSLGVIWVGLESHPERPEGVDATGDQLDLRAAVSLPNSAAIHGYWTATDQRPGWVYVLYRLPFSDRLSGETRWIDRYYAERASNVEAFGENNGPLSFTE